LTPSNISKHRADKGEDCTPKPQSIAPVNHDRMSDSVKNAARDKIVQQ
jgi:hypothetical protein